QRYHDRVAVNERVDAAVRAPAVEVVTLSDPGQRPAERDGWRQVTATGVYDPAHTVLVRARTFEHQVGYEVLVPLRLSDGSAVLVDRGWIPSSSAGAATRPDIPPVPGGQVSVTGRLRLPESSPGPLTQTDGLVEVRRIDPMRIGRVLPYPVLGGWLSVEVADPGLRAVAAQPDRQPIWMNVAYVIQWWLFAAMVPFGFVWLARREAGERTEPGVTVTYPSRR
nr:SURF1 family protein [Longispora sp. (in: high G+C Gram-positive bacteria)]